MDLKVKRKGRGTNKGLTKYGCFSSALRALHNLAILFTLSFHSGNCVRSSIWFMLQYRIADIVALAPNSSSHSHFKILRRLLPLSDSSSSPSAPGGQLEGSGNSGWNLGSWNPGWPGLPLKYRQKLIKMLLLKTSLHRDMFKILTWYLGKDEILIL